MSDQYGPGFDGPGVLSIEKVDTPRSYERNLEHKRHAWTLLLIGLAVLAWLVLLLGLLWWGV